jgi:hypothetical protein
MLFLKNIRQECMMQDLGKHLHRLTTAMSSCLNFLDSPISDALRSIIADRIMFVLPVILMPFIAPNAETVVAIRFWIASSHTF